MVMRVLLRGKSRCASIIAFSALAIVLCLLSLPLLDRKNMADFEDGGDANEKLQHEEVDVSQLKLPEFKGFGAQEVRSGEEDEDVIYNE